MSASEATPWFAQAASDLRVAWALGASPVPLPMVPGDAGCHVAAMCAQAIEKSIKAYVIVNGATPSLNHRPDKYLPQLLTKDGSLLRHSSHHSHLSRLFDSQTRHDVGALLDLTPGGQGNDAGVPNTEYPWKDAGAWKESPVGSPVFGNSQTTAWIRLAQRVFDTLRKLGIAAERGATL